MLVSQVYLGLRLFGWICVGDARMCAGAVCVGGVSVVGGINVWEGVTCSWKTSTCSTELWLQGGCVKGNWEEAER